MACQVFLTARISWSEPSNFFLLLLLRPDMVPLSCVRTNKTVPISPITALRLSCWSGRQEAVLRQTLTFADIPPPRGVHSVQNAVISPEVIMLVLAVVFDVRMIIWSGLFCSENWLFLIFMARKNNALNHEYLFVLETHILLSSCSSVCQFYVKIPSTLCWQFVNKTLKLLTFDVITNIERPQLLLR